MTIRIDDIWKTLEKTASAMEMGEGDWHTNVVIAQVSMRRLFEFPFEEIVLKAAQSHYPTKALIQWLLHEGQKVEGLSVVKLHGLCDYWNETMGEEKGVITFPPLP